MTLTVNEFAASMNVDYGTANSLLKFLVSRNLAKELGKRAAASRGKPSTIYEVPEQVTLNFSSQIVQFPVVAEAASNESENEFALA